MSGEYKARITTEAICWLPLGKRRVWLKDMSEEGDTYLLYLTHKIIEKKYKIKN